MSPSEGSDDPALRSRPQRFVGRLDISDLPPEDQPTVRALILQGLSDHWGEVDESLNPDLDDLLGAYASGRTIVGRVDGTIVATGTIVPRSERVAEILRMSVDRNLRGAGLGRQILEALIDIARTWNVEQVILETTSSWHEVVSFYLQCGFTVTHEADGPFGSDTWFSLTITPDR